MKKLSLLFVAVFLSFASFADDSKADLLFQQGVDAYNNEHYDLSVKSFSALPAMGYYSADLYYNMGNAYYRLGDFAKAVWCYEKALLINPSHNDAEFNLQFVNNELFAGEDVLPPSFFTLLWNGVSTLFSPHSWILIFLVFQLLFPLLVLFFFFSTHRKMRLMLFSVSLLSAFIYVLSIIVNIWSNKMVNNPSAGVVKSISVSVRSEPGQGGTDIVVLEQARKVKIHEKRDEWLKVELSDGTVGWILSENIMDLSEDLP